MSIEDQVYSFQVDAYLDRTIRQWLGVPASASIKLPDMPGNIRERFLRAEEFSDEDRNARGNWEHSFSPSYYEGKLWEPEVDVWLRQIRSDISTKCDLQPLWPEEKTFAACFTHDVDRVSNRYTVAQLLRMARIDLNPVPGGGRGGGRAIQSAARLALGVAKRRSSAPALANTIERCAALEKKLGIHASYFFTVYPLDEQSAYDCVYTPEDPCVFGGVRCKVGDVMGYLATDGHDVGLHGSFMSSFDANILHNEKIRIERVLEKNISTTRQHYLHWDARRTPPSQEEAGFLADSTLGFSRNIGFRSATSLPYKWFDLSRQAELDLLQIPLVVQDVALISAVGLALPEKLSIQIIQKLIDRVRDLGGLITFLFHPDRLEDPAMFEIFKSTAKYCVDGGAWTASVAELRAWWDHRHALLASR